MTDQEEQQIGCVHPDASHESVYTHSSCGMSSVFIKDPLDYFDILTMQVEPQVVPMEKRQADEELVDKRSAKRIKTSEEDQNSPAIVCSLFFI
jgi:hypothetical protein